MKRTVSRGLMALMLPFLTSCGLLDGLIKPPLDAVDKAVSVIDRGIADITRESTSWRNVLQRIAGELPAEISSTIRNDAQNLANRSIATAGTELRCNVDFLANRAVGALQGLRARLLNQPAPALPPGFCQVVPEAIELSAQPASWSRITLNGYDLDQQDGTGKTLQVFLLDSNGAQRPLPESRIGRTTHYQVTLNLGGMEREIYAQRITKLLVAWNSQTRGYPEVVVVPWAPRRRPESVSPSATSFMPPHVRGDRDFDTGSSEPMSIDVQGELSIDSSTIKSRVFMRAREERSDWTEVNGWSAWQVIYTAPLGWKIFDVKPATRSRSTGNITNHDRYEYRLPAGEVVTRFEVWGDRSGDEAGTYTRVVAHWNQFNITLEELAPAWTLSTP